MRPSGGQIRFHGQRFDTVPAHKIVTLGLAHSPESRRLFPRMTVEENLLLGAFGRRDKGIKKDLHAAYELFPILGEWRAQPAGTFSGGEQQMLAMGRATLSKPTLKGYVLEVGRIVTSGTGAQLLASDEVRKAYLGED